MLLCSVPECDAKAVRRGLCAKHYLRLRRHGDVHKVNRAGRKPDRLMVITRQMMDDVSPRTQARFARILRLNNFLKEYSSDPDIFKRVQKVAARPNGSLNFSKLLELMEVEVACWIAENGK